MIEKALEALENMKPTDFTPCEVIVDLVKAYKEDKTNDKYYDLLIGSKFKVRNNEYSLYFYSPYQEDAIIHNETNNVMIKALNFCSRGIMGWLEEGEYAPDKSGIKSIAKEMNAMMKKTEASFKKDKQVIRNNVKVAKTTNTERIEKILTNVVILDK